MAWDGVMAASGSVPSGDAGDAVDATVDSTVAELDEATGLGDTSVLVATAGLFFVPVVTGGFPTETFGGLLAFMNFPLPDPFETKEYALLVETEGNEGIRRGSMAIARTARWAE